ncbi:hypothetical protein FOZ60_000036 [Perkinsus olseni]|uniref:Uncharacterized protein n=1 Tax=Perkinsus olseni TaxID=32597 RepID=A0A7J6PNF3_PEROL|nr:hypothetical protein FOZ60_000036 [Perkinsus olseni]
MKFAHTILIASQALTFTASQAVGRFMYSFGDDTRMAFDVYEGGYIALVYDSRGKPAFIDGTYPLRPTQGRHAYAIAFDSSHDGYDTGDSLYASFQKERLRFIRVGFELSPGVFEGVDPLAPHITLTAITALFTFPLERVEQPYLHFAANPTGIDSLDEFQAHVKEVCPEMDVEDIDFSRIVYATPDLVYIPIEETRFALKRKSLTPFLLHHHRHRLWLY